MTIEQITSSSSAREVAAPIKAERLWTSPDRAPARPISDTFEFESGEDLRGQSLPRTSLKLSLEQDLGRVIATVEDIETGEIVRQVPPDELVELAKAMRVLLGQLIDRRV